MISISISICMSYSISPLLYHLALSNLDAIFFVPPYWQILSGASPPTRSPLPRLSTYTPLKGRRAALEQLLSDSRAWMETIRGWLEEREVGGGGGEGEGEDRPRRNALISTTRTTP
jgi:hypothetical protein